MLLLWTSAIACNPSHDPLARTGPQYGNKCLLKVLVAGRLRSPPVPAFAGLHWFSAPDRDIDRRPEPGRRNPAGRRAHQVHGFRCAEVAPERADRRALVLPFQHGDVPAGV